jgi:WD40 repeat protein
VPAQAAAPPLRHLTPLYRFRDTRNGEHVYTYGDGEPADWRKNPAFTGETVVGYASVTPLGDTAQLWRAYCRDTRHYLTLGDPSWEKDILRHESFAPFVWVKPGDGRVPVHACFLPDGKDAYFDVSLEKVRAYAAGPPEGAGPERKVVEEMFYLYPTGSAPSLPRQPVPVVTVPAGSLPPLPEKAAHPARGVTTLAATPDGSVVAVGGMFPGVSILDRTPAATHRALAGRGKTDRTLALAADGRYVAAGGAEQAFWVWDVKTGEEVWELKHRSGEASAAFTPDGKTLFISGESEKQVRVWDTASRKVVGTLSHPEVRSMAVTPDGKFLATCRGTGVRVWDLATGTVVSSLPDPKGNMLAVALTPDGKTVAIATSDGLIRVWDVGSGLDRVRIDGHPGYGTPRVKAVAVSPDGRLVASAGAGGVVGLWEVATGRGLASAPAGGVVVSAVAFADGGKTLLATAGGRLKAGEGEWPGGVRGWDLSAVSVGKPK